MRDVISYSPLFIHLLNEISKSLTIFMQISITLLFPFSCQLILLLLYAINTYYNESCPLMS